MKINKFLGSFTFLIILVFLFAISTAAILSNKLVLSDNAFSTGGVNIILNDGKQLFDENDFVLQPDASIKKEMTIKNAGTGPVYYKIYMENVEGTLSAALMFRIYKDGVLLKETSAQDFINANALISETPLEEGKTNIYEIEAYMSAFAANTFQKEYIGFDLVATAVQSKNNPDKSFE